MKEVQEFPCPLDLLVYSPSEWQEMQHRSFVRNEILAQGTVLH
jgi:hypothetical protein